MLAPIAYAYDATTHCAACATRRYSAESLADGTANDREGNPVGAIFEWDSAAVGHCDDCADPILEPDPYGRCPACADPVDYCLGHGPIGDPVGSAILELHDSDDHSRCHPDGCSDSVREYIRDAEEAETARAE